MTAAQKIIKYIATAFAIFLTITIISAILSAGYAIINALGLVHKDEKIETEDLKVISSEVTEISKLKIDLSCTNLIIETGDSFIVETNNEKITFSNNNGNINIEETNRKILENNTNIKIIIYIPENMKMIEETNIKAGAGKIDIQKLRTKSLYLKVEAGEVNIDKLIAEQEVEIDGGVGKTELKSCEVNNLRADLGVGEFRFSGKLTGKNEIDSGVGAVRMDLTDKKQDYTLDISKGLGNILIDGESIKSDVKSGSGENYLNIDGGVGEIKIDFSL